MNIKFKDWNCIVVKKNYSNPKDRIALQLIDAKDGSPIAMATVNLPDEPLQHDEVFIKNWSENQGMLQALYSQGVIARPHGEVRTGFELAYKCKLLI